MDPKLAQALQELQDSNRNIRRFAAEALGEIGDATAVEPLRTALRDTDLVVRQRAAWALSRIGAPAADALCQALWDPDYNIHFIAIETLGNISIPAIGALCEVLEY